MIGPTCAVILPNNAGRRWQRHAKPALLVVYVTLGGCATAEQINAQHDATCRSWGTVPGSETYVQCRALLSQQQANEARVERIEASSASSAQRRPANA
jgi:hypothetical protein